MNLLMNTRVQNFCLPPSLIGVLCLMMPGPATAQYFTNLHNFTGSDGSQPQAGLVISGGILFGATDSGGAAGRGAIFKINADGSGFTNLYSFTGSDGDSPDGTLVLSGNTLYGTAYYGGSADNGTVFALNTDGSNFTNLYSFKASNTNASGVYTNRDGANPEAGLVLSGGTLYGTTEHGGTNGYGTVFRMNLDGSGFTNLHGFANGSDGSTPEHLLLSGSTLYGTASGFASGNGTVFKLNTDGSGFTTLHVFIATNYTAGAPGPAPNYTNQDGALPSNLSLSGNTLYGTAYYGGSAGNGTIFALGTDGNGFTNLHNFAPALGPNLTNSEGTHPINMDGLVISENTLYGTAYWGGASGFGTVFALNTDGTGFWAIHNFTSTNAINPANSDGANPYSGLSLENGVLYGTTKFGGAGNYGTVFRLLLPPKLAINAAGTNLILRWSTNAAGFALQAATNLSSPSLWASVSPAPVVINTNYVVTNNVSGSRKFYRLSH